ncbi:hypothetical protein BP5796_11158 [Coleophoma crateriformis]|uniref:Exonuclease domain-containing protein n=1 Tax=Coleophoma crateriformis TaxID=565419 RepID=A0A3D8QLZ6_9HELO|nr:hypothetical protein BP5796_11158 [Coleophoma crateriformis]
MFQTKGLFSQVRCPHAQSCLLPNCIFLHPAAAYPDPQPSNAGHVALQAGDDHDGQRKRRKVESEESTNPQLKDEPISSTPKASQPRGAVVKPHDNPAKKTSSLHRPVSPPPLRRPTQDGKQTQAAPTLAKVGGTTKAPAKAPLKKEGLNPRALKRGAPATHDMRFRLLRALHEQFVRLNTELAKDAKDDEEKLVLSEQELITKALDIEENATASAPIYSNVVKNNILLYKRMTVAKWKEERAKDVAAEEARYNPPPSDPIPSKPLDSPKVIETGLNTEEEINLLPRLLTPVDGLSKHGYVNSVPTATEIAAAERGVEAAKGWEVCDRCKSRFQVFPERREEDGALSSGGPCIHHYGKPYWQDRLASDPKSKREKRYRCCGEAMGDSSGCTKTESHVFKITEVKRLASVLNFIETPANANASPDKPVCIDGEMGYTVFGLELIRLTATSWPSGSELLDVLVKPVGGILDLNSRYSGVWPADMAEAIPYSAAGTSSNSNSNALRVVSSPAEARSLLLQHLSPQTPLIGHGLENDLNAIRLVHPTLIDTALLFPHKAGLPYRNALKMLMETHLNRRIQVTQNVDGKVIGHDSKEDANAAGELVRLAIGREWARMRREGWKLMGGAFLPPTPKETPVRLSVRELERDFTVPAAPQRIIPAKRQAGEKRNRNETEFEEGEL